MDHSLWGHLPLLVRSTSKESVEYILQTLWRTRKTGLDRTDRDTITGLLQLPNENDLDPEDLGEEWRSGERFLSEQVQLLVCLRVLIRRCVYDNISKDDIQKLFPQEVSPELQRLLVLLLQKFQREWRDDVLKDQVTFPRLKAMTWNLANQEIELADPVAVINLKLQDDSQPHSGETEVKFQLEKDTLETMVKSMYSMRNQMSDLDETSNGNLQPQDTRLV